MAHTQREFIKKKEVYSHLLKRKKALLMCTGVRYEITMIMIHLKYKRFLKIL